MAKTGLGLGESVAAGTPATPLPSYATKNRAERKTRPDKVKAMFEFNDANGVQVAMTGSTVRELKGFNLALRSAFLIADLAARDTLTFDQAGSIQTVKVETLDDHRTGTASRNAMIRAIQGKKDDIQDRMESLPEKDHEKVKLWCAQQIFLGRT